MFNEYFHGDNGAGLGASHQTGWTGLVADLIRGRPGDGVYTVGEVAVRHVDRPGAAMSHADQRRARAAVPARGHAAGRRRHQLRRGARTSPTAVELCLFDAAGAETRVPLLDVRRRRVARLRPRRRARPGLRLPGHGPYDPPTASACNPAKLLLDPYARAITGEVTFGPEVLGYDPDRPDVPSSLDSAGARAAQPGGRPRLRLGDRRPRHRTPTPTRSSTRCTSRASP